MSPADSKTGGAKAGTGIGWLIGLVVTGAALIAMSFEIGPLGANHRDERVFVGVALAGFPVFLLATALARRVNGGIAVRRAIFVIVTVAVLMRLPLWLEPPKFSTDMYRYVWEGKMINNGVNPFRYPPQDPSLAQFRDELYNSVCFKNLAAMYPAVAEYFFALAYRICPLKPLLSFKFLFGGLDLGVIALLMLLLRRFRRRPQDAIIYAWHPLVVTQLALDGHLDAIGIFLLLLAIFLATSPVRRGFSVAIATAASIGAKGYSILCAAFLAQEIRGRKTIFAIQVALCLIAVTLPFVGAGSRLFASLIWYGEGWEKNAGLFRLIRLALSAFAPDPRMPTRIVAGTLLLALLIYLVWCRIHAGDLPQVIPKCLLILAGFLLVSPVVYPWYVCWTVPFLCFVPWRSWLLFTGLVVLSTLHNARGHQPGWVVLVEYIPFLAGLAVEVWTGSAPFRYLSDRWDSRG